LPAVDLGDLSRWGRALLRESSRPEAMEVHERSIERACAAVDSIGVESMIHTDLDPSNVFLRGDEVRFIDLNEMHRGPLPLIASMFAERLVRSSQGPDEHRQLAQAIYYTYESTWPAPFRMKPHLWPALEIVSALFAAHLGWTRVQTKVRHGEIRGVDALVRSTLAKKVVRAIALVVSGSPETVHRGAERWPTTGEVP